MSSVAVVTDADSLVKAKSISSSAENNKGAGDENGKGPGSSASSVSTV